MIQTTLLPINPRDCQPRDFKEDPFIGNAFRPNNGLPDAVHVRELIRFIFTKAASDSSILEEDDTKMSLEAKLKLRKIVQAYPLIADPTPEETSLFIKCSEFLSKAKRYQKDDDAKAERVLQQMATYVSSEIAASYQHLLDRYSGHGEEALQAVLQYLETTYPFQTSDLKSAILQEMNNIGYSNSDSQWHTLVACETYHHARLLLALVKPNPVLKTLEKKIEDNTKATKTFTDSVKSWAQRYDNTAEGNNIPATPTLKPTFFNLADQDAIAETAINNYKAQQYIADVKALQKNKRPNVPSFTFTALNKRPNPPATVLCDPNVPMLTDLDMLKHIIGRVESDTRSTLAGVRDILAKAIQQIPIAAWTETINECNKHIAANPQSLNHTIPRMIAEQYARTHQGNASASAATIQTNDEEWASLLQGQANAAAAFSPPMDPAMRAQIMELCRSATGQPPLKQARTTTRPCDYFGVQPDGEMCCSRERLTGTCDFKAFHFPTTLPPARTWMSQSDFLATLAPRGPGV